MVERIDRVPGGKGGNVSVAAARILGPNHVALLACVGSDDVGKRQILILRDEGVDTSGIQVLDGFESGQAYITVDAKGTNVIETHFGANAGLKDEHVARQNVQELMRGCSVMVVIDPPRHVAPKFLAEGRRLRRVVIWHPGVLTRFGIKEFENDMDDLDYLALNQVEAFSFTKARSLQSSLASIGKYAPKTKVLVTLGSRGAALYENGKLSKVENVKLGKLGLKIVNTTGCGDAFVGAFAAYKVLGRPDIEAVRYANMAGALKATRPETRGSPLRKELEEAYTSYFV